MSETCFHENSFYTNQANQGSVDTNDDALVPLTLWYSGKYEDNYVSTSSSPPDSTYDITVSNGYVYENNNDEGTRLSLDLYFNSDRHDHATVADASLKSELMKQGYKLISTQGYVDSMTISAGDDWRLGISSQVLEVPPGFEHETVVVAGEGINDVMLNEWSSRLQSLYHTSRVEGEKDIVTSHLGYWTDNGAYYYGDSWGATTSLMNLTCCSLDVFKDVKKNLDKANIPIRYWQMDDWWYYGLHPNEYIPLSSSGYWSGVKAVQHWDAPSEYYPGGISALSADIEVPLLLYGPYFSPDNDWIGDFSFIPENAGFVLPSPEDSYAFYSALFDFGINASTTGPNTGMAGYEVDFMSCLSGIPEFRTRINAEQEWLNGMNQAAAERGIPIQCR